MEKINWENGEVVSEAYVTIDEQNYPITPKVMEGATPLSADNLNLMQENIENEFGNQQQDIQNVINYLNLANKTLWSGSRNTVGAITINNAKLYSMYVVYVKPIKDLSSENIGDPIIVEHREQGDYITGSFTSEHSRGLYTLTVLFENTGNSGTKGEQWDFLGTSKMFHNKNSNHSDYEEGFTMTKIIGLIPKAYDEIKNLL